ncbi:hypothetical protein [Coprococcus comes]|nr:hypothetical protein [Coprococcus comes]
MNNENFAGIMGTVKRAEVTSGVILDMGIMLRTEKNIISAKSIQR